MSQDDVTRPLDSALPVLRVDFAGELHEPDPAGVFTIGRSGDLSVDEDNLYLHRQLLAVSAQAGLWWLANVGERIAATVSDSNSRMEAWLAPGARMPIVFPRTEVAFSAGTTTYQVDLSLDAPAYLPLPDPPTVHDDTTLGRISFTAHERLLIVALAEPTLRRRSTGVTALPSLTAVGDRLAWSRSQVNRTLDRVCDKLKRAGVRGVHQGEGKLANDRRARLVQYALSARIVGVEDLGALARVDRA